MAFDVHFLSWDRPVVLMIPTDDTCIAWIQFLFFILSLSDRRSGLRCTRTKMGIRDKLDGTGMGYHSLGLVSGRILVYSRLREFLRDGNGGLFLGLHACMMCERKNWEWMSDALTGGADGWMSYDGLPIYIPHEHERGRGW